MSGDQGGEVSERGGDLAGIVDQVGFQRRKEPQAGEPCAGVRRRHQALTQEEIDLVERWVNGGSPEGNPNDLPARPKIAPPPVVESRTGELVVSGDYRLPRPFVLDGFVVRVPPSGGTARITIEFPDGRVAPLVWFDGHPAQRQQPFLLRVPLSIPAGASMRGMAGSTLVLLPPAHPR